MGCSNSHFLILEPLAFVYRQCRAIWFTLGRGIRILLVCKFLDSVILYRVEIHSLEGTCHAYAASPFFLGVGRWQKSACPPCHHICCNANFSFHPIGGMPGGLRQAAPDALERRALQILAARGQAGLQPSPVQGPDPRKCQRNHQAFQDYSSAWTPGVRQNHTLESTCWKAQ